MLIVVVIIGILAAALIPRVQSAQSRARDVARIAHMKDISTALELYSFDSASYPTGP
jgi:type II secretory pathway pseudopilin PulG